MVNDVYYSAMQAVIGALLIDTKYCAGEVFSRLSDKCFITPELRTIFTAIRTAWQSDGIIDPVVIAGKLPKHSKLIVEIVDKTPTAQNYRAYVDLVLEQYKSHVAAGLAATVNDYAIIGNLPVVRDKAAELIGVLDNTGTTATSVGLADAFGDFCDELDRNPDYIKFGFPKLDGKLFVELGDYIVIGARPSVGKTALALNFASSFADKYKTLFFSLETSVKKLQARYFSCALGIEFGKIKSRSFSDEEKGQLNERFSTIRHKQLEFVPAAGMSSAEICAEALRQQAKVIFVDYIGLVNEPGKNDYEKVTNASKSLHTFAQQHNVLVIVLSQFSREGAKVAKNSAPTMESLRESGQLEQDADVVILLHRPDEGTDRNLYVAKNKEGTIGMLTMGFAGQYQRFTEVVSHNSIQKEVKQLVKQQNQQPFGPGEAVDDTVQLELLTESAGGGK